MTSPKAEICVGVAYIRGDQIALIKRAKPPNLGHWSLPGGRVEFGEPLAKAAGRELREETGLGANIGDVLGIYEFLGPHYHYVVIDYRAQWTDGEPQKGSDAADARFFSQAEALEKVSTPELRAVIQKAFAA